MNAPADIAPADALRAHHEALDAIAARGRRAQRQEFFRAVAGAAVAVACAFGGIAGARASLRADHASADALEREIAATESAARHARERAEEGRQALDAARASRATAPAPALRAPQPPVERAAPTSRPLPTRHSPSRALPEPELDLESGPDPFALDDAAPVRR